MKPKASKTSATVDQLAEARTRREVLTAEIADAQAKIDTALTALDDAIRSDANGEHELTPDVHKQLEDTLADERRRLVRESARARALDSHVEQLTREAHHRALEAMSPPLAKHHRKMAGLHVELEQLIDRLQEIAVDVRAGADKDRATITEPNVVIRFEEAEP